jgi:GntR family transcriptional regulator, transcriptional repressor for pyruvate dehydrogenase complex
MTGSLEDVMAVTDEAIEKLKAMIISGELRPGTRLPREADLASALGLSRSSLREAVRALSLVRILDVRQGDGTYVSSLASDSLLEALNFIVEFHHDASVLDLLEVRRILEPAACARAAVKITAASLANLEMILLRTTEKSAVDELVAADIEFHSAIAVAAGNPVLASLIEGLSGPTQRARVWRGLTEEGALNRTLSEHRSILLAIKQRDPELARTWATVHIAGVEEWLRRALADPESYLAGEPALAAVVQSRA